MPDLPASTARAVAILERNLERYPWAYTGDHAQLKLVLPFADAGMAREWRVTHRDGDRLPGPFDADVYVAVCQLFNAAGRPAHRKVVARFIDLAGVMGRTPGGNFYRALDDGLHRLAATTIECENVWRREGKLRTGRVTAHIFDKAETVTRAENPVDGTLAVVTLGEDLARSIDGGHFRLLDANAYFALGHRGVTKRLYRYLDYRRWAGHERRTEVEFPLEELRREVPIDRTSPSHVIRSLTPAHTDLVTAGFLQSAVIVPHEVPDRRRPDHGVRYAFTPGSLVTPFMEQEDPAYVREAVAGILEVLGDERSAAFYAAVAKALPPDVLRNVLGGVREDIQHGASLNRARRLFTFTARKRAEIFGVAL